MFDMVLNTPLWRSNTLLLVPIFFFLDEAESFWSSWTNYSPCDISCIKRRQRFCTHNDKTHCTDGNEYGIEAEERHCTKDECSGI